MRVTIPLDLPTRSFIPLPRFIHTRQTTPLLTSSLGSIGLMLAKVSVMRVTIPLDLSTRSFIPLPHFIHTRRTTPLLTSSLELFPQHSV